MKRRKVALPRMECQMLWCNKVASATVCATVRNPARWGRRDDFGQGVQLHVCDIHAKLWQPMRAWDKTRPRMS